MKKLFTILTIVALTTTISFSQVEVEQGSFLLEIGNNRFLAQSVNSIDGMGSQDFGDMYNKYNINEFNLGFGAGYFVIDGLAIGLGLQYASSSTVIEYTNDYKDLGYEDYDVSNNELIISPGVRYYFGESGVWTSLDYVIATISMNDSDGSYDDAEFPKRSAMNLKVGYAISLNDYVSLNPIIGYNLTTQTTKDAGYDQDFNDVDEVVKSGALGIGVSLTVHLGY
jgi:hypothetical protein